MWSGTWIYEQKTWPNKLMNLENWPAYGFTHILPILVYIDCVTIRLLTVVTWIPPYLLSPLEIVWTEIILFRANPQVMYCECVNFQQYWFICKELSRQELDMDRQIDRQGDSPPVLCLQGYKKNCYCLVYLNQSLNKYLNKNKRFPFIKTY